MIAMVMGTTGSGKTTIGKMLARRLEWTFLDADDFHSAANIEKMTKGIALDDADRAPWLASIHDELVRQTTAGKNAVLACSALKQGYRDVLSDGLDLRVVYLKGSYEVMKARIEGRHGHFAKEGILAGQFRDLEEPKEAIIVDVRKTPEEIVTEVAQQLHTN